MKKILISVLCTMIMISPLKLFAFEYEIFDDKNDEEIKYIVNEAHVEMSEEQYNLLLEEFDEDFVKYMS